MLGEQVLRSGTSIGAHYREAQRAKSDADFVNKLEGGLQEAEEMIYWLELLADSGIVSAKRLQPLIAEAEELIKIFVAMVVKVKNKRSITAK